MVLKFHVWITFETFVFYNSKIYFNNVIILLQCYFSIGKTAVNLCSLSVFANSADKQRDLDPELDEAKVT